MSNKRMMLAHVGTLALCGLMGSSMAQDLNGVMLLKEAPENQQQKTLESIQTEMGGLVQLLQERETQAAEQYTQLNTNFNGIKADSEETKALVKEKVAEYAQLTKDVQAISATIDMLKKEAESPLYKGGKDLEEHDRKIGIELQRRAFLFKGGNEFDFVPDADKIIDVASYRSAARKMMAIGIERKEAVVRTFTEGEKKAFAAADLDSAFFSPEMLGIEIDCTETCAEMVDLYDSVTVSKSNFMYPQIKDWGAIGQYDCDAKCDAEFGEPGNIQMLNGRVYDFRGVFCFSRKVLQEANYDLLNFMFRTAARSYRINRNRVLISGDGVNEPLGWLTADCFPKLQAATAGTFDHVYWRKFLSSVPTRFGQVIPVMHQNVFALLATQVDSNGRFIFGDGLMSYTPNDVRENLRMSDCLPDPTEGGTTEKFAAGSFIAAAGNWPSAYAGVVKRPMWLEQFEGGSTAWCVKYVFGAEDGGFTKCCDAARVLVAS